VAINEKLVAQTPLECAVQVNCHLKLSEENWPLNFN